MLCVVSCLGGRVRLIALGRQQDKKAFFQGLGCDSEIVKICVRDSKKPRDYKMDPKTEVGSTAECHAPS